VTNESGQITVFVLGISIVCFAVAGLAVDGTRVFLARRTLQSAADSAALAGAAEIDRFAYYTSGGKVVSLEPVAARRLALQWLAYRGVGARASVTVVSDVVTVALRTEVPTSLLGLVGVAGLPVAALARASPVAGSAAGTG
jgi:uncharacterized membrane protein